jgi:hypothetical protein
VPLRLVGSEMCIRDSPRGGANLIRCKSGEKAKTARNNGDCTVLEIGTDRNGPLGIPVNTATDAALDRCEKGRGGSTAAAALGGRIPLHRTAAAALGGVCKNDLCGGLSGLSAGLAALRCHVCFSFV